TNLFSSWFSSPGYMRFNTRSRSPGSLCQSMDAASAIDRRSSSTTSLKTSSTAASMKLLKVRRCTRAHSSAKYLVFGFSRTVSFSDREVFAPPVYFFSTSAIGIPVKYKQQHTLIVLTFSTLNVLDLDLAHMC